MASICNIAELVKHNIYFKKRTTLWYNIKMDKVVVVDNLVKIFSRKEVLRGVSFNIRQGSIYGLLGPNGAGKTTIIKIMCGVYKPTKGSVYVSGMDVSKNMEKIRSRIGYMSQKFTLYEDLTVDENISFYANIYGLKSDVKKKRIDELTNLVSLTDRGESIVRTLSGGWKQRLALVCALLHSPPILILDEPTAGVDPVSRKTFWNIIRQLSKQGLSVLVTTHYMDEAEFCDKVSIIYDGKLIIEGSPLALIQKMGLRTLGEVFDKSITDYEAENTRMLKQKKAVKK